MSTSNQSTTESKDAQAIKTEIFDLYSDITKPKSPHRTGRPGKNVAEQAVALGRVAVKYNKSIFDVCEMLHEKKIEQRTIERQNYNLFNRFRLQIGDLCDRFNSYYYNRAKTVDQKIFYDICSTYKQNARPTTSVTELRSCLCDTAARCNATPHAVWAAAEQYMSHSLRAVRNSLDYTKPNYWIRLLLSVIFITLMCLVCDLPRVIKSLSIIESIGFIIATALFTADFVFIFLPVTTQWLRVNKLSTKFLEVLFSVFSFLIVYQFQASKMTSASMPYLMVDIWLIVAIFVMWLITHNKANEVVSQQDHIRDLQDQLQTLRMSEPQQIVEPDTVGHAPKESSRLRLLGMVINPFQRPRF